MRLTLDTVLNALVGYLLIFIKHCGERGHVDLSEMLLGSQVRHCMFVCHLCPPGGPGLLGSPLNPRT